MQNNYETVCIVKPDVGDDIVKGVLNKSSAAIETGGGTIVRIDEWGRRRLAYPIQKKNDGYFFVMTYKSEPAASKELERLLKLNEDVLRYQTIKLVEAQVKGGTINATETAGEQQAGEA